MDIAPPQVCSHGNILEHVVAVQPPKSRYAFDVVREIAIPSTRDIRSPKLRGADMVPIAPSESIAMRCGATTAVHNSLNYSGISKNEKTRSAGAIGSRALAGNFV